MGTVPDWLGLILTATSVLIVGLGLLREIKKRRLDDEQAARERRDAQAQQARLVSASIKGRGVISAGNLGPVAHLMVEVANDSDGSIHDVGLSVVTVHEQDLMPGETGEPSRKVVAESSDTRRRVDAHKVIELPVPYSGLADEDFIDYHLVRIRFTDSAGRRWERDGSEHPRRAWPYFEPSQI